MLTSAGAAASSCRPFRFPALRPGLVEDHVKYFWAEVIFKKKKWESCWCNIAALRSVLVDGHFLICSWKCSNFRHDLLKQMKKKSTNQTQ